jgi:heme A synthase
MPRTAGHIALFASAYTYVLIVVGGTVRITGSGMGCGDTWPRCHGRWLPTMNFETFIDWLHRLLAFGIGIVVLAAVIYAVVHRSRPGIGGAGGVLRPLLAALVLVVIQGAVGAASVRMEFPAALRASYFVLAAIFIAVLLLAAVRAGVLGVPGAAADPRAARRARSGAMAALGIGFAAVVLGALVANVPGAPQACQGFPLCNGRVLPAAVTEVHLHWAHRLAAFLLFVHVLGATVAAVRRGHARALQRAALVACTLITTQLFVAAVLVLRHLPQGLQTAHLALGTATWCALVVWAALARRWQHAPAPRAPEAVHAGA